MSKKIDMDRIEKIGTEIIAVFQSFNVTVAERRIVLSSLRDTEIIDMVEKYLKSRGAQCLKP